AGWSRGGGGWKTPPTVSNPPPGPAGTGPRGACDGALVPCARREPRPSTGGDSHTGWDRYWGTTVTAPRTPSSPLPPPTGWSSGKPHWLASTRSTSTQPAARPARGPTRRPPAGRRSVYPYAGSAPLPLADS